MFNKFRLDSYTSVLEARRQEEEIILFNKIVRYYLIQGDEV